MTYWMEWELLPTNRIKFIYKIFTGVELPPRQNGSSDFTYGNIVFPKNFENFGYDSHELVSISSQRPLRHAHHLLEVGDCYFIKFEGEDVQDDELKAAMRFNGTSGTDYTKYGRKFASRYDSEKKVLGVWRVA